MSPRDRHARRLNTWLGAALILSAALGALTLPLALSPNGEAPWTWPVTALLIALPIIWERTLERRGASDFVIQVARWLQLPALAVMILLGPAAFLLAVLVLAQAHLFLHSERDGYAGALLSLAPTTVVIGLALSPAVHWLVLFPLTTLASVWAMLLLQARGAHRSLVERTPIGLVPGQAVLDEESQQRRSLPRLGIYALPLSLAVLTAIPLLFAVVLVLPEPMIGASTSPEENAADDDLALDESQEARDAREAFGQLFPSSMDFERGVSELRHEVVMHVAPYRQGELESRDLGPLYMRGLVLDEFTESGARFSGGTGAKDYTAGPDGLTQLGDWQQGAGEIIDYEILQQPLYIRRGGMGILFAPQHLLQVSHSPLRYDADGLLVAPGMTDEPDIAEDWFRYHAFAQERRWALIQLGPLAARHPDRRFLQLPGNGPELRAIRSLAEDVTAGSRSDEERVAKVLAFFHEGFEYALEASDFPGLRGVTEFLDKRRGSCTSYAATATLMLRSLKLPARIATGFVAKDFDPTNRTYRVTTRESHAWVEVHFEGFGWVTIDPTPGELRSRALADFILADSEPGVGSWSRELYANLRDWARTGGGTSAMRDFASTLIHGPAALWASARQSPLGSGIAVVVVSVLLFRRLRRRPREAKLARAGIPLESESLYRALLNALARRGHRRSAAQTLREFARQAPVDGLQELCEIFYRERFGGVALDAGERAQVTGLIARLKAEE